MYDPVVGRFISPDTIVQDWYDPQNLNRYAYCRNNPLKYVDPDGHAYDIIDVGFFAQSAYTFARNPSWANAGWLAADTVSLLPVVPSMGYARVASKIAGKVADVASNANKADNSAKVVKALDNAPKKPIAIGENQKKVDAFAKEKGAETITDWRKKNNKDWSPEVNDEFISTMKKEGRKFKDIGPDFDRRLRNRINPSEGKPPSKIYGRERKQLLDYDKHEKLYERTGKYSGK